ncbi:helix-turn-helix transcriptional regulator [Shewanella sedimentimangrovi]|uniref:Helix-turn-helix transcriptional regulator n=2 Tax=Shewanella sedimentimangrovi TaxID=2814293 RepID=A0ABX7QZN1_9GAMM|nr:helix-turn-helix transcriptional regulator [Shewanella sedimentimangrovi]
MNTPLPKKTVRGSNSGVAIMAVFDLLGRKWNMRLLWELRSGACSFRSLQERCDGMSPSVMNSRVKQLTEAMLIEKSDNGYVLTALGADLMDTLDPLRQWAADWESKVNG